MEDSKLGGKFVYRCKCGRTWTSNSADGGNISGQECKKCGCVVVCLQTKIEEEKKRNRRRQAEEKKRNRRRQLEEKKRNRIIQAILYEEIYKKLKKINQIQATIVIVLFIIAIFLHSSGKTELSLLLILFNIIFCLYKTAQTNSWWS